MTDIEKLFQQIDAFNFQDTDNVKIIRGEVRVRSFFPGGKGTFENDDTISNKDIMILGQDFGTMSSYEKERERNLGDKKNDPTWRNLLAFLCEANIDPSNCFYTNAIMGVRTTGKISGKNPVFKNERFILQCQEFFLYQLEIQQPKIILVLGKHVAEFLSSLFDEKNEYGWRNIHNFKTLDADGKPVISKATFKNKMKSTLVLLTHPSYPVNARHREYEHVKGRAAEFRMVSAALKM